MSLLSIAAERRPHIFHFCWHETDTLRAAPNIYKDDDDLGRTNTFCSSDRKLSVIGVVNFLIIKFSVPGIENFPIMKVSVYEMKNFMS